MLTLENLISIGDLIERSVVIDDVNGRACYNITSIDPVAIQNALQDEFEAEDFRRLDECVGVLIIDNFGGEFDVTFYNNQLDLDEDWDTLVDELMSTQDDYYDDDDDYDDEYYDYDDDDDLIDDEDLD